MLQDFFFSFSSCAQRIVSSSSPSSRCVPDFQQVKESKAQPSEKRTIDASQNALFDEEKPKTKKKN
jgi:hypothetical protein